MVTSSPSGLQDECESSTPHQCRSSQDLLPARRQRYGTQNRSNADDDRHDKRVCIVEISQCCAGGAASHETRQHGRGHKQTKEQLFGSTCGSRDRLGCSSRGHICKRRLQIICLVLFAAQMQLTQAQSIKTVMGGAISWRLENDFETSRNVTFTLVSFWDKSEIAYEGTGVDIVVGLPVQMPSEGLTYASRFGNLEVKMGDKIFRFPNKFIVAATEGNLIEGWFSTTFQVPVGAYYGNASLVGPNGERLQRSGVYETGGVVTSVTPNGGLQRCEMAGPSPIPCEVYAKHLRGVLGPNPIQYGFFATISLPKPGETEKFYRGKVRNRNSPTTGMRPVIWITDTLPGKTNSFMVPAFDRDGDPVKTFVGGSKQGSSGSDHISCANGNMTSFGCFGPVNKIDGPPYDSTNFVFSLTEKVATASEFFFYSFTMNVSDGYGAYSLTEVLINYCNPIIQFGATSVIDRAPEFVDVDASGKIFRRRPTTFLECDLKGPCFVTIYAARFSDNAATTPSRHPDQLGNLNIVLSGSGRDGQLRNQTVLANGMVFRNFTFGRLPDGRLDEIGGHRIVCFTVQGHTKCQTPPLCITVKDDVKFDVITPTPVCAGFSVSFEIRAYDPDAGELVTLDIYDSTGDGNDIFSEPYNAQKIGNYTGTAEVANARIIYTLDYAEGVQRDPVTRAVSFARDRQVCTVAVDNTLSYHYAFGDLSDTPLYAGNFVSRPKCHEIAFSGPPAFLTSPSRFDGTPFAAFDGTVEERMRTIDAFIGVEKSITFRAKDPNYNGRVKILIMEDPGIPNGAVIGPSTCEPQKLIVSWNASGLFSECAIASRTITWTPPPTVHYQRNYRICAVARDSTPIPECPSEKMTDEGWYGEEHCTEIKVIPPQLIWTSNSELGASRTAHRNVFVPCATEFMLEAEETGSGFNNTGGRVLTPYQPVIIFAGAADSAPTRASLRVVTQGRTSRSILAYSAARGDEGRVETVCFTARDDQFVLELPPVCVTMSVKRCVYCVNTGDTLQRIMQEIAMDFNWLRLWAANGNEDGDPDTLTVMHPDDLMKTDRQHIINVGSIYTVQKGDNLAALAVKFQTTVKQILSLNPDVAPVSTTDAASYHIEEGQPLCIVPCAVLPRLPDEGDVVALL